MKVKTLVAQSCPTLFDPMDCVAHQTPPSVGFSRQEYWSGLPFSSETDPKDEENGTSTYESYIKNVRTVVVKILQMLKK